MEFFSVSFLKFKRQSLQRLCARNRAVLSSGDKICPFVQNSAKVISSIAHVLHKTNEPVEVYQVTHSMTFMPFVLVGVSVARDCTWIRIISVSPRINVIAIIRACSTKPVRSYSIKMDIAFVKVAKWYAAHPRTINSNADQIKSITHAQMTLKLVPNADLHV